MDNIKVFTKNGVYTGLEYAEMKRKEYVRKQKIKLDVFISLYIIAIIFRAYVFFTYNI